jgi:hypothetical protein
MNITITVPVHIDEPVSAPFEEPPEQIKMRGTQGFRYVYEPLW